MPDLLYTVGYSGFIIDDFLSALHKYNIDAIVDVRSYPYSSFYKDYDKESLIKHLKRHGVMYGNFAYEFGARQEDKSLYLDGRLDFEKFAKTKRFQNGVDRIITGASQGHVCALLCAEKNPILCHRTILVARAFFERGFDVQHIVPSSVGAGIRAHVEIENEILEQLDKKNGRGQISLFEANAIYEKSREEKLVEAYRLQNDIIGFRLADLEKLEMRDV